MVSELESERVPVVSRWLGHERLELDRRVVMESDVVGFTTTGAAKMRGLVVGVQPEIVIVEEAAEILESHVITALTGHCNHLILIGDHLQLRPTTCVYELETKYRMNVSLFERMILNGVKCCTLKTQHRMRPEIADLVVGTVYDELLNHNSVYRYPHVRGVRKDLYFVDHAYLEDGDTDGQSKSNQFEAEFITGLCNYLLKQSYSRDQITILTGYTGQMFVLKRLLEHQVSKGLRITTVDNYQGEENDIVLLSLVRSNPEDKAGFIGVDNRVCVALTRARVGLYVVGNMGCMASRSGTWRSINRKLVKSGAIGGSLELVCGSHGKVSSVACNEDFEQFSDGGCRRDCGGELACGHVCKEVCHVGGHEGYKCGEVCAKVCGEGHACGLVCWMECYCRIKVMRGLECGHTVEVDCGVDLGKVNCNVRVAKVVCGLGHEAEIECHVDPGTLKCDRMVVRTLGCGHEVEVECHVDPGTVKCGRMVSRTLGCGHEVEVKCHVDSGTLKCGSLITMTLDCGHEVEVKCHVDRKTVKCSRTLSKTLSCGHEVDGVCSGSGNVGGLTFSGLRLTSWNRCVVEVDHEFPGCKHQGKIQCWKRRLGANCTEQCGKTLDCGHVCQRNCHVTNDPDHKYKSCTIRLVCRKTCHLGHVCNAEHLCSAACVCRTEIKITLDCGHEVSTSCGRASIVSLRVCRVMVPKVIPSCGHTRMVECHVDPKDHKCTERIRGCGKVCDQGHPCSSDHGCSEECTPCVTEKIEKRLRCGHTAMLYCHDNGIRYKCNVQVSKTLVCGHNVEIDCHNDSPVVACKDMVWTCCESCGFEGLELCRLERKPGSCFECSKPLILNI